MSGIYGIGPVFERRQARFYTAHVKARGVWSYQIDGTFSTNYRLIVFYGDDHAHLPGEGLDDFDSVEAAERAAEEHFRRRGDEGGEGHGQGA
jgi:hypothetical protein